VVETSGAAAASGWRPLACGDPEDNRPEPVAPRQDPFRNRSVYCRGHVPLAHVPGCSPGPGARRSWRWPPRCWGPRRVSATKRGLAEPPARQGAWPAHVVDSCGLPVWARVLSRLNSTPHASSADRPGVRRGPGVGRPAYFTSKAVQSGGQDQSSSAKEGAELTLQILGNAGTRPRARTARRTGPEPARRPRVTHDHPFRDLHHHTAFNRVRAPPPDSRF